MLTPWTTQLGAGPPPSHERLTSRARSSPSAGTSSSMKARPGPAAPKDLKFQHERKLPDRPHLPADLLAKLRARFGPGLPAHADGHGPARAPAHAPISSTAGPRTSSGPTPRSSSSASSPSWTTSSTCYQVPDLPQLKFLEIFAGDAAASAALNTAGAQVLAPWDRRRGNRARGPTYPIQIEDLTHPTSIAKLQGGDHGPERAPGHPF